MMITSNNLISYGVVVIDGGVGSLQRQKKPFDEKKQKYRYIYTHVLREHYHTPPPHIEDKIFHPLL